MFSMFGGEPRHIRRARAYLQEARMAMLEHSIAAEHYQASAEMYAERARRLEEEIASWEGVKNGGELLENFPEVPSAATATSHSRLESASSAIGNVGNAQPTVGIVRAA